MEPLPAEGRYSTREDSEKGYEVSQRARVLALRAEITPPEPLLSGAEKNYRRSDRCVQADA